MSRPNNNASVRATRSIPEDLMKTTPTTLVGKFDRSNLSWFEWIVYRLVRGSRSR
ncbi:hypothetical protein HQO24_17325 [Rhodococcus fascians]|uniref:hypothetical protein n=1 Tax=Rhodococcus sp. 06-1474-1B TaxID=2022499 RepID=UPI001595B6CF|nr:hypothetical protein [Rhodococcus sp. 06-1474-1B]MBY4383389.1 hypothetical protein [Rhodococcus fascians]MBY4398064.1 hypothetical protein [Rhodococcus fascians]MBY4407991.1 hypothetical protein [Rhodococcus fascians]MBY4422837.1 hypothetical protein [Rhodococcus fascians]MBY4462371.1 hypothetical protein [Rhodococcus fascians]